GTVRVGVQDISADDQAALDGSPEERRSALNRLLFPAPAAQFTEVREQFGDLSIVDTVDYLYGLRQGEEHVVEMEQGVSLYVGLEAIGDADDKGMRTVMTTMNGQLRPVFVRDRGIKVETRETEKADASKPGHVAAP